MSYKKYQYHLMRSQAGLATLMVTLILLIVSLLLVLYVASSSITEQRLSANQVRTKQAFMAASAGLDQALDHAKKGGIDRDSNGVADSPAFTSIALGSGSPSKFRTAFCETTSDAPTSPLTCPASPQTLTCAPPASLTTYLVWSCGWSDDDTAVQKVTQVIAGTPATPGGKTPPVPLIALGSANLLVGGASIMNYFNDLTAWSGTSFQGQSNTGKTFIRDISTNPTPSTTFDYRDTGNSPACNNPPSGYVCSTQGSSVGLDVIQGDRNLASLTPTTLFNSYFGQSKTDYRDKVATWKVDLSNSLTGEDSTNINSIYGKGDTTIWVQGNGTIDGTVGSPTKPVVLIVDGDLDLGAGAVINGLVFVTGNLNANGTPTVFGTMTVAGDTNTTGNMKVVYDPFPSKGTNPFSSLGTPTKVNGSWKDW